MNTELLLQTVHSVKQISVYAAVTDWCYQFVGLANEEKEQVAIPVSNFLTMVETEEVEMLVSPPNLALRNKMQGSASFRILEKRVQMTQLCGEELLDNLLESKEGEPYEEREVTPRHKDTWAAPSTKETRAGFVNLVPNKASLYTKKIIPTNEKKWITIHAHSGRGSDLAVSISKTVTTMLRHFHEDERESDGSRRWESIKSVSVKMFAYEGVRDFSDDAWLQKIFEGSTKKRIEYCNNKDGI